MVHYSDYLKLDAILHSQDPESAKKGSPAHDEMLFIVIHQAYELWFKQLIYELDSVRAIMASPSINDNSPQLQTVVHRLSRMVTILKVLVHQVDIMETMTPMDFLDFRDMLRPASGFQSWQFKVIEALLGLRFENRHGREYYISQLRPQQVELIRRAESEHSLLALVNNWLERMPFTARETKWQEYREAYLGGLTEGEEANRRYFGEVFGEDSLAAGEVAPDVDIRGRDERGDVAPPNMPGMEVKADLGIAAKNDVSVPGDQGDVDGAGRGLSPKACRSAVFIMMYRGYPILQLPFQLINNLLEIDEQMSSWRYRHMNMVHRMIGTRVGTGGSSGRDYLKGAADRHYIFAEFARLNSFLVERRKLPGLDPAVEHKLGLTGGISAVF